MNGNSWSGNENFIHGGGDKNSGGGGAAPMKNLHFVEIVLTVSRFYCTV